MYSNLLSFSQIKEHLPWNVILFAGGCLSLSEGFQLSGLSDKIGNIFNQIWILLSHANMRNVL